MRLTAQASRYLKKSPQVSVVHDVLRIQWRVNKANCTKEGQGADSFIHFIFPSFLVKPELQLHKVAQNQITVL